MNWQSTARAEARKQTAKLYTRDIVRRMRGFIDTGPGFFNDDARRTFPSRLWAWASEEMLSVQFGQVIPPKESARELDKFYRSVHKAVSYWVDMPDHIKFWVARHDPDRSAMTGNPTADRKAIETAAELSLQKIALALSWLEQTADGALSDQATSVNSPRREGYALERLADLWVDWTGKKPTRTIDVGTGKRVGAFVDFAYDALYPMFPEMGSIDGLIDKVTNKNRPT